MPFKSVQFGHPVKANRNYHAAARSFNEFFPDRPASHIFVKIHYNYERKRSGRTSVQTEELQIQVLGNIAVLLKQSLVTIAFTIGTSNSAVHEILI